MENELPVTLPVSDNENTNLVEQNPPENESEPVTEVNPASVTEVTTMFDTVESSVSNVLDDIAINTKQTADCATTLVAFACIVLFILIGKWLYNTFKDIFF